MTQTARTIAEILALAPNDTTRDISPRDLRDIIATLQVKYGELYITASAATTISDTTNFFDLAGTWMLGEAEQFNETGGNGRLTYVGTPTIEVFVWGMASINSAGTGDTAYMRLEKNGADLPGSESVEFEVGTAILEFTAFGILEMATDDYVNLAVRNETDTDDLTATLGHMVAVGIAK
ncbi:MAG: hypothetical protein U5Q03_14920 [Bacteroidota bacterium]|nr:hypothetical protein [Bacteroidota bacterium]